eukprot:4888711-Lingulodinium_polyedra.AAC.1
MCPGLVAKTCSSLRSWGPTARGRPNVPGPLPRWGCLARNRNLRGVGSPWALATFGRRCSTRATPHKKPREHFQNKF